MILPKISCVMITYRRFTCVERSISMFLKQDYTGPSELIILNTDMEHPLTMDDSLKKYDNIFLYNNSIDFKTGLPYSSTGAIRRDSTSYATGYYYICWDDDDIFLPWNNRQGIEGIIRHKTKAWKPFKSFFSVGKKIEVSHNYMEASVTVDLSEVKDSFNMESGTEHMKWYHKLSQEGHLSESSRDSVPSYCFNWSDPVEIGGHKQSNRHSIEKLNNFEAHKNGCFDYAKRPLKEIDLSKVYEPYYNYFANNKGVFNPEYYEKYVKSYLA